MERRGVVRVSGRELKSSLLQTKEIFKRQKEKEKILVLHSSYSFNSRAKKPKTLIIITNG